MVSAQAERSASRAAKERLQRLQGVVIDLYQRKEEAIDPLRANYLFTHLAQWRREGSGGILRIRQETAKLVARVNEMDILKFPLRDAYAAHRDTSIALSASVLPSNEGFPEVDQIIPGASTALHKLRAITGLPERGDIDQLYALDPITLEPNSRRFTDETTIVKDASGKKHTIYVEDWFKASIREGMLAQTPFLNLAREIASMPSSSHEFALKVREAAHVFSSMSIGMAGLKSFPEAWFTENILPFLERYKIAGIETYHSGEQMIHVLAWNILSGISRKDPNYRQEYQEKNLAYATSQQASVVREIDKKVSILGTLLERVTMRNGELINPSNASEAELDCVASVMDFISEGYGFRKAHGPTAKRSLARRASHEGSGGDSRMLHNLMEWTAEQQQILAPYLREARERKLLVRR